MKHAIRNSVLGVGLAGALAMVAPGPSSAGAVPSNAALVKMAAAQQATDVRYRRAARRYGYRSSRCVIEGGYHRQMTC
jgi:hypothetical protein